MTIISCRKTFKWLLILQLTVSTAMAQNADPEYKVKIGTAFSLYEAKAYASSARAYSNAFRSNGGKGASSDRYNAACAWAMAGKADSAFAELDRIVKSMNFSSYTRINEDPDLAALHGDPRWAPLLTAVKQNQDKAEAHLNKPLVRELETIFAADQAGRGRIDSLQKIYGMQSPQVRALFGSIRISDSLNLMKVKVILDKYGWLGPQELGTMGAITLFAVIQHADLATQKHYLPVMHQAVKDKKLAPDNLALLEDRIAVKEGRKQIYGSQLRTDHETGKLSFQPIEDEKNVNKRRAEVGLEPMEEYAKKFNLEYKLPVE
jgi:hypothetical protein